MTTPHRDASLLRAIADGKQMQTEGLTAPWADASGDEALTALAEGQPCRIKPEFVLVNGAECPKPLATNMSRHYIEIINVRDTPRRRIAVYFESEHHAYTTYEALIKPFKECQE